MKWLAVVLLAGCGRLGFESLSSTTGDGGTDVGTIDARPCTPVGHDEDNDSVDDACDVCPHISGAQTDGDGDGVGDACDPEPTMARQQIVFFDPFTSLTNWINLGATQGTDEVIMNAVGMTPRELIRRPFTSTNDLMLVGMTTGAAGTGQYNVAIVTTPTTPPGGFYCELFDDGGAFTTTMFTWTLDDTNYMHAGASDWANNSHFANGSGTFSYALSPTTATCQSIWNGVTHGGNGARPAIAAEELHVYVENVAARLRYFIQIRTN